jgi:hypothetical protein
LERLRASTYAIRAGGGTGATCASPQSPRNATGAVGIVFRFRDVNNHYGSLSMARATSELTKRVNGVTQLLFSHPSPLVIGQQYKIVVKRSRAPVSP